MILLTDYTERNTFNNHLSQQYRVLKLVRDILNDWFADRKNILDLRLVPLLYDNLGILKPGCIRINTVFDELKRFIGTTPAIVILLGDVAYNNPAINIQGNPAFVYNKTQPPTSRTVIKSFTVNISIVTLHYDATVLLALLILLFLQCNMDNIKRSCLLFDCFFVQGISAPQVIQAGQELNAKQLYKSTITISTAGHITWLADTQGPVFNGFELTLKSKE